ncbi:SDR family oxidoreductase [Mycolicibacter sp. MYC123]|uniref:SDR family oxidoreductase n=1 Tax=[Mycobacterium] zoologicum TaxID=2872311 RepID=A0ABU5YIJ0_9MYCO|nr:MULTISPECIES: SDR family oxidoreductase [unclassified Mycolicibacter]MEB3049867.1 SDR family oxidoreductase [Mycolicibacter sp. MYC123]MEB3062246.1 SDR family oxidoreductase [Mycolicibacter sp. MYC101]
MILVTGATGNVGSEAVRLLSARHHPTRALVRDPSRVAQRDALDGEIEFVIGDFDRPDTLDAALDGICTVILVSPAAPVQEIAVIDSAVRQGVRHIVKVSSKASSDSPVERRRGQARIEAHLESTGLAHTLLRPNAYLQNLLAMAPVIRQTGGFVMSAGDGQVGMIDARDVAAGATAVAVAPSAHAGCVYWLSGPDLITYAEISKELTATLGHEVEYRRIGPDEHRAVMIAAGVPEAVASSNAQAFGLIAEGDAAWLTDDVATLTGTAPRSLGAFIAEYAPVFA